MDGHAFDAGAVLARLRELPGARALLELAAARDDVELVGGTVRDLALSLRPRELDVVVARGAREFARELSEKLDVGDGAKPGRAHAVFHERFGTALIRSDSLRIDIATRREESYAAPGALPKVRAGTPEQDLRRRDFTVNAIALSLSPASAGELRAVPHALDDLQHRRLRVLHDASFLDDPTRLFRLARYAARLRFQIEPHTAALAAQALAGGALSTVSGARIGAELRLALQEPDALGAFAAMDDLGLLAALDPRVRLDRELIERALALLPADGRPELLAIAAMMLAIAPCAAAPQKQRAEIAALLDRLGFHARDRDRVASAASAAPRLLEELPAAERPSQLRALAVGTPPEGVALAGAMSVHAAVPARRWLSELRHVRLRIDGEDLLAAGVPKGPEIGRRLGEILCRRLDGELPDEREAQLRAALARP